MKCHIWPIFVKNPKKWKLNKYDFLASKTTLSGIIYIKTTFKFGSRPKPKKSKKPNLKPKPKLKKRQKRIVEGTEQITKFFFWTFFWNQTFLNKTNEVKFWLTIYSYSDVSMIMVIIIKKNKYLKKHNLLLRNSIICISYFDIYVLTEL